MGGYSSAAQALAAAIQKAEGYGVSGAIPTVANNPGDLNLGNIGYGTTGSGITIFPNIDQGSQALLNQANAMLTGSSSVYNQSMTLAQAGQLYSGGDSNWANNVASSLGVPTSTTLGQLNAGQSTSTSSSSLTAGQIANGALGAILGGLGSPDGGIGMIGSAVAGAQNQASNSDWLTRAVLIVIGIIMIGVGISMFKQTQVIVGAAGRVAERGAKLAGALAV